MSNLGWTDREEEFFNPQLALMRYCHVKPLIGNYNTTIEINEKEKDRFMALYISYTAEALIKFIKERPELFARDVNPKKIARKIADRLADKITGK